VSVVKAFAARKGNNQLEPFSFRIGPIGPHDVDVRVQNCGICHSDIAMIENQWGMSQFPVVAGHEIVGIIENKGAEVRTLEIGDRVGIGWQCSCCCTCEWCQRGKDQLCPSQGATIVGRHGGFAEIVRVDGRFAVPIPQGLASIHAAPLMCAGTTVFAPILQHGVSASTRAAVQGIGGLGHLALQFLSKMGCEVTAISTSRSKEAEARKFGACDFIDSNEPGAFAHHTMKFDFILSTITGDVDWNEMINTLRPEGKLVIVGAPPSDLKIGPMNLLSYQRQVVGGRAGSPADAREMLHFAARRGVVPMIEQFSFSDINTAIARVKSGQVRYRAVLCADSATLSPGAAA
jgi:alcohol/geraniol dehydrogenase (NADP+)